MTLEEEDLIDLAEDLVADLDVGLIASMYEDFDPDAWAEIAMTDMECFSNDDCPRELGLSCGWYEYNYDWSEDFCVPTEVCGEEYEKDGVYVGIYCLD